MEELGRFERWFLGFTCGSMCNAVGEGRPPEDYAVHAEDLNVVAPPAEYEAEEDQVRTVSPATPSEPRAPSPAPPPATPDSLARSSESASENRRVSWADAERATPLATTFAAAAPSPPRSPASPASPREAARRRTPLTPRGVELLCRAGGLGDLPLSSLRMALAPLSETGDVGGALEARFAAATGLPAATFVDDWTPAAAAAEGGVVYGVVYGVCSDLGVGDSDVLHHAASGLEFSTAADVAALVAGPGDDAAAIEALLERSAAASAPNHVAGDAPHRALAGGRFSEIVEAWMVDAVARSEKASADAEAAERAANQRRASELARAEQRRRSSIAPASPDAAGDDVLDRARAASAERRASLEAAAASEAPHLASVEILAAAARLDRSSLRDACDLLHRNHPGDGRRALDAAADTLRRLTTLPASFFSPNFILGSALDARQIAAFCFATAHAIGADDAALEALIADAIDGLTVVDIADRVAPCCAGPHRSGRDAGAIAADLVAAVAAVASDLPRGFVNERVVVSAVLDRLPYRRALAAALTGRERAAEDAHYDRAERAERDATRRKVAAAMDEEQQRLTEEMDCEDSETDDGEFQSDEEPGAPPG